MKIHRDDIHISKVVGETEEGLTLFIPKDESGVFHLTEGDKFLTLMFIKQGEDGSMHVWTPWE